VEGYQEEKRGKGGYTKGAIAIKCITHPYAHTSDRVRVCICSRVRIWATVPAPQPVLWSR